jgi:hypothetical protein
MICVSFVIISGCASMPKQLTAENTPDKVIARIDELSSRPEWLRESTPFEVRNGEVISLGSTVIPADNRVEAAFRIAENNAKASIAGAIEQRLEFVFQNAEEGTSLDATQARFIGAEASNLITSSIRPGKRYWEKVAITTDSGERITRYKVFSTVTMPESDFRKSIIDAARRAQGKGGLSQDFAKKVDQHWDQFTGSQRAPTSQPTPIGESN